jgi:DNA polymerase-1
MAFELFCDSQADAEDDSILKIGQNMKYITKIFKRVGITVDQLMTCDVDVVAMNAGLNRHSMDVLSEQYLVHADPD